MKTTLIIASSLLILSTVALGADLDLAEPPPPANTSSTSSAPAAKEAQTGAAGAAKQANVLNFEADVIEGEKKGADLLLEIESTKLEPDTVLYQRADFNDFHARDLKRRPRIAAPPSSEPVKQ